MVNTPQEAYHIIEGGPMSDPTDWALLSHESEINTPHVYFGSGDTRQRQAGAYMHYAPVPTYQSQEEDESDLGSTSTETSSDSGNEPVDMSYLTSLPQDQAAEVAFSNTVAPEDAGDDLQENQLDNSVVP